MEKMAGTLVGLMGMYGWLLEHWFSQQWYYCSSMAAGTNTSCGSGRIISVVTMMIVVVVIGVTAVAWAGLPIIISTSTSHFSGSYY